MEKDEVYLLGDELIQLSIKSSNVFPKEKPMLFDSVWTKKSFNPNSLIA